MKSAATFAVLCIATTATADHRLTGRDLDTGAALYAENCATCHGADLEGQPNWREPGPDGILPAPPHDVTGHTCHHDTQALVDYTLKGGQATIEAMGVEGFTSGMPGFEDSLGTDEVLDILAYIRSTWPEEAQEVQRQRAHGTE